MKIDEPTLPTIQFWEEHAFYESGLSAHGCFEDLDEYAKKAIHKYGRILLKQYCEYVINNEPKN